MPNLQNFLVINNSDLKVCQTTSPYWVPTMHSIRVYQCLQHTSILPVTCLSAVLHSELWLQSKKHNTWQGCSQKWSYRVRHTSVLRNEHPCFCCYRKEDCNQSNQSRLHHYWNSYGVYSTISKAEPLPSVLLQIPVTNWTVNGSISCFPCSYFHSCSHI